MSGVKRVDFFAYMDDEVAELDYNESDDGAWVRASDYDTLRTANRRLEGEVVKWQNRAKSVRGLIRYPCQMWDGDGCESHEYARGYNMALAVNSIGHIYRQMLAAAPPPAPAGDVVQVPLELANRLTSTDNHVRQTARRELRNMLLNGGRV